MNRGRMFEYTPTEIEKRLAALDGPAIACLGILPTFLTSEIIASGEGYSMLVEFEQVSNLSSDRSSVNAGFILPHLEPLLEEYRFGGIGKLPQGYGMSTDIEYVV